VELADGETVPAAETVLAAGVWSAALARRLGLRLPLEAGKGYHLELDLPAPELRTGCVLSERYVAVTPLGDRLRLAGTVELSGINRRLVRRRLEMLREGAAGYLRGVATATARREWCGLRPCTADGLPVVGWAPDLPGLFVATGHAKMGLTHGPVTGRLVSECLLDGSPSLDIRALRADRF
jgi:D-amino-acid dehydrogenase